MIEKEVQIKNKMGLHARAAGRFVELTNKFVSDIYVVKGTTKVDAKSIMGILSMAIDMNDTIMIKTSGVDEKEAMEEIINLIDNVLIKM